MIEVILSYPGLHALISHRVCHRLHRMGVPVLPRLLSQLTRFLTGIEIHPGAQIGESFFIDHGMGVVIGETAVVGNGPYIRGSPAAGQTDGKRHHHRQQRGVAPSQGAGQHRVGDNAHIGAARSSSTTSRPTPRWSRPGHCR
jgi:serine O-acetyltransferase